LLALKSKIITNTTKLHSPVSTKTFFIMSDNDCYEYDDDVDEDTRVWKITLNTRMKRR
jgi:hypothetical protein